jgi:preprotein translocase subunit YajC
MRLTLATFATLGILIAAPAAAQSVGMQIVDTAGNPVGSVTAINGDNFQVKTDKHEVLLPKSSFTANAGKLLFGMTQAQLNAEIEKSEAAANAAIVAGATVKGLQGTEIGKIDSVSDSGVVIALSSGKKIQVARNGVRGNPDGTVVVGLTADQLEAATKMSGGAAAAPAGK